MRRFAALLLLLAACPHDDVVDGPVVRFHLDSSELVAIATTAELTVVVYENPELEDQGAEVVNVSVVPLPGLPLDLDLGLPPDLGSERGLYFIFYVDQDKDGRACPGDLVEDYPTSGPFGYGVEGPPDRRVEIRLHQADASYPCRDLPPE